MDHISSPPAHTCRRFLDLRLGGQRGLLLGQSGLHSPLVQSLEHKMYKRLTESEPNPTGWQQVRTRLDIFEMATEVKIIFIEHNHK